jgi:hypothetical protein
MRILLPIAILIITLTGCKTKQPASQPATAVSAHPTVTAAPSKESMHQAHAIIYRTRADYSQYVPITLSDDGSTVASYPAPGDIYYRGVLSKPTVLADGYLLDNRGVNPHTVFIKMTYEEYSSRPQAPTLVELYKMIIDKAPFTEIYDLGPRNLYAEDEVNSINAIIQGGKVSQYKKIL